MPSAGAGPDLVVVGGGLIGLSVAFEARSRGLAVEIIGEPRRGEASRAAAGLIAPSLGKSDPRVRVVLDRSRDLFEPFVARVAAAASRPVDVGWGLLEVSATPEEGEELMARTGPNSRVLSASEAEAVAPGIHAPHGASSHTRDGWVIPGTLMSALGTALDATVARVPDAVVSIATARGGVALRLASGLERWARRVVVAGGSWSSEIDGLPRLDLYPLKGELLELELGPNAPRLPVAVAAYDRYLVPRGSRLIVGATSEEAGFDAEPTALAKETLLSVLRRVAPRIAADALVVAHWTGLRPMTPDRLPLVGDLPEVPGVLVATGHGRNGVLLSALTALAIGAILTGSEPPCDLSPFSPTRFRV